MRLLLLPGLWPALGLRRASHPKSRRHRVANIHALLQSASRTSSDCFGCVRALLVCLTTCLRPSSSMEICVCFIAIGFSSSGQSSAGCNCATIFSHACKSVFFIWVYFSHTNATPLFCVQIGCQRKYPALRQVRGKSFSLGCAKARRNEKRWPGTNFATFCQQGKIYVYGLTRGGTAVACDRGWQKKGGRKRMRRRSSWRRDWHPQDLAWFLQLGSFYCPPFSCQR